MKKTLFAIIMFAAIIMGGCRPETRNELLGIPENAILLGSESYVSANDAKAWVGDESIYWASGDSLKLNDNSTPYLVSVDPSNHQAYIAGGALAGSEVYGWTSYNLRNTNWNPQNNRFSFNFPSSFKCTYDETNKLQKISVPMATYTTSVGKTLKFWHVSSAIKVCVRNEISSDTVLKLDRVVVSCSTYELAGFTGANLSDGDAPSGFTPSTTSSLNSVTVDFTDDPAIPYSVSEDYDEYIAVQVPIRSIGDGSNVNITVKVYAYVDGSTTHTFVYEKTATIPSLSRNQMVSAGCRINRVSGLVEEDNPVSFNPSTTPLTFEAKAANSSVKFVGTNNTFALEFSLDGGSSWSDYTKNTAINLSSIGDKVSFRSKGATNDVSAVGQTSGWSYVPGKGFICTGQCYVYGNILSIIRKEKFDTVTTLTADFQFASLFVNNNSNNPIYSHADKALVFPATKLRSCCYAYMFYNCSNIETAPELPAPTLVDKCYRYMFYGCSSLSSVRCLATSDNNTTNCSTWLSGVAASGTFTKASTATWTTGSASGIPSGWTTVNAN